jgi:hypothetical protein
VARTAEGMGFSWAYWQFDNDFIQQASCSLCWHKNRCLGARYVIRQHGTDVPKDGLGHIGDAYLSPVQARDPQRGHQCGQ